MRKNNVWRVQYGLFYLNDKLVFDAVRFSKSVDLDQLSQLQRFIDDVENITMKSTS